MLRNILGGIAGYVVMVVVALAGIGVAWLALGGSGAFDGEGPYPSTAWIVLNLMSGLIAAFLGGLAARKIGRSPLAVMILAGLVLVLGIILALTAESSYAKREPVEKPVAEMSFMEAGQHAKQPTWYNWVIPLVGAAGALAGGRDRRG